MDGGEDHAVWARRCSAGGEACGCEAGVDMEHPFALSEEYEPEHDRSGRFLAAGAERSFWLRIPAGELARASATVRKLLAQSGDVIVESNSLLELVQPDVFLMLLDFACEDFKASSLRFMDRADAFVMIDRGINAPLWDDIARGMWDQQAAIPGEASAVCDGRPGGIRSGADGESKPRVYSVRYEFTWHEIMGPCGAAPF